MPTAVVTFKHILANSQTFGGSEEHMTSQVFFDLTINNQVFRSVHVDVKQTVGASFEDAHLEVSRPIGYVGPMNHDALSRATDSYYKIHVGAQGKAFNVSPKAFRTSVINCKIYAEHTVKLDVPTEAAGW